MTTSRRKPLQFGLRDLLWGVLVVALMVGWAVDHRALSAALEFWVVRRGLTIEQYRQEVRYLRAKLGDHAQELPVSPGPGPAEPEK